MKKNVNFWIAFNLLVLGGCLTLLIVSILTGNDAKYPAIIGILSAIIGLAKDLGDENKR